MKLLEYMAREIFWEHGIPVKKSIVIDCVDEMHDKINAAGLKYPVVVKAQVQAGGRGKAGGVRFAENGDEAERHARAMFGAQVRGFTVKELLVVEKTEIETEWYLSIITDRQSKGPLLIFSPVGGVDIEETAINEPDKIAKVPINIFRGIRDYDIIYALDRTGADMAMYAKLKDIAVNLYNAFIAYDCLLAEINPLAITPSGEFIAADGKVEVDDSALYRLPKLLALRDKHEDDPLVAEARRFRFHFIRMDADGTAGVISNGSGMLMGCIDMFANKGIKAGAALDLGGGATAERVREAVRIIFCAENISTLLLNIFGGITRCDEVANGVRMALADIPADKKVVIRMDGTNREEGLAVLADTAAIVVGSTAEGAEAICASLEVRANDGFLPGLFGEGTE